MGKQVLYAQPNYVHSKPTKTHPFATPRENLSMVVGMYSLPWMIVGNFNEILLREDKYGGQAVNTVRALRFQECLNNCGMIDLGFSGPRYTWSNHRPLTHLIQERMDRVFANADWNVLYPDASVKHLEIAHSDHNLVLLSLANVSRMQFT